MTVYVAIRFDPPAPVIMVTLRSQNDQTVVSDVPMLLDSGADVSLVPETAVRALGILPISERQHELVGFDGKSVLTEAVFLEMVLVKRTFRGQFLLINQEWRILGRNILNHLPILLDGPNLSWEIHHFK
jgi:hypothetical protein